MKNMITSTNIDSQDQKIQKKNYFLSSNFINLYGIGRNRIALLSKKYGLNIRLRSNRINDKIYSKMYRLFNSFTYENNLKDILLENRKFVLDKLKNYKSIRHSLRYPVRGQRTHTNGKTRKKLKKSLNCNLT